MEKSIEILSKGKLILMFLLLAYSSIKSFANNNETSPKFHVHALTETHYNFHHVPHLLEVVIHNPEKEHLYISLYDSNGLETTQHIVSTDEFVKLNFNKHKHSIYVIEIKNAHGKKQVLRINKGIHE